MNFAGINHVAVVVAAAAAFLFGAVWYGILGRQWLEALGKTKEQIADSSGRSSAAPFITSGIALLIMAWVMAGIVGHLGPGNVTLKNGLISALFVWAGFVATTLETNHGFQGAKRALTLIDGGHWLGVLLIQGAVIGLLGV